MCLLCKFSVLFVALFLYFNRYQIQWVINKVLNVFHRVFALNACFIQGSCRMSTSDYNSQMYFCYSEKSFQDVSLCKFSVLFVALFLYFNSISLQCMYYLPFVCVVAVHIWLPFCINCLTYGLLLFFDVCAKGYLFWKIEKCIEPREPHQWNITSWIVRVRNTAYYS